MAVKGEIKKKTRKEIKGKIRNALRKRKRRQNIFDEGEILMKSHSNTSKSIEKISHTIGQLKLRREAKKKGSYGKTEG